MDVVHGTLLFFNSPEGSTTVAPHPHVPQHYHCRRNSKRSLMWLWPGQPVTPLTNRKLVSYQTGRITKQGNYRGRLYPRVGYWGPTPCNVSHIFAIPLYFLSSYFHVHTDLKLQNLAGWSIGARPQIRLVYHTLHSISVPQFQQVGLTHPQTLSGVDSSLPLTYRILIIV